MEEVTQGEVAGDVPTDSEARLEMTSYVVQRQRLESPSVCSWDDIETVEIPRKASRKNALQVVLEGADGDTSGNWRVLPVLIAEPYVVSTQTEQRVVIA